MAFDVTMDKNQYNLKVYHRLVREMPVKFTFEDAEELFGNDTEKVLRKARKLQMIGAKNIQNRYDETIYFVKDLYCRHYHKGKYSDNNKSISR